MLLRVVEEVPVQVVKKLVKGVVAVSLRLSKSSGETSHTVSHS